MKTLLSASLLVAYALAIVIVTLGIARTAMSEEIRFQTYTPQGIQQGTVRPWAYDSYRIESHGPQGYQQTIIRVPGTSPLDPYLTPPAPSYAPLPGYMWEE